MKTSTHELGTGGTILDKVGRWTGEHKRAVGSVAAAGVLILGGCEVPNKSDATNNDGRSGKPNTSQTKDWGPATDKTYEDYMDAASDMTNGGIKGEIADGGAWFQLYGILCPEGKPANQTNQIAPYLDAVARNNKHSDLNEIIHPGDEFSVPSNLCSAVNPKWKNPSDKEIDALKDAGYKHVKKVNPSVVE